MLHFQYDAYGIATIFTLGLVMGAVRYKTGSLWSVLIIHALFNLVALVETYLYMNGYIG